MRNQIRRVEYEGIHLVCFNCGVYGHRQEACPKKKNSDDHHDTHTMDEEAEKVTGMAVSRHTGQVGNGELDRSLQIRKSVPTNPELGEDFGSWMLVTRPTRKFTKSKEMQKDSNSYWKAKTKRMETEGSRKGETAGSTRFNVLYDLEAVNEVEGAELENGLNIGPNNTTDWAGSSKATKQASIGEDSPAPYDRLNRRNSSNPKSNIHPSTAQKDKAHIKEAYLRNEQQRSDITGMGRENTSGVLPRPKRAAAEAEHTVVRGINRGKTIERQVVSNFEENTLMFIDGGEIETEHHQDDPAGDDPLDDGGMVGSMEGDGANGLQPGATAMPRRAE